MGVCVWGGGSKQVVGFLEKGLLCVCVCEHVCSNSERGKGEACHTRLHPQTGSRLDYRGGEGARRREKDEEGGWRKRKVRGKEKLRQW